MSSADIPQLLGGTPVFDPALPMASPQLPDFAQLLPDFQRIIESGQLTKGAHLRAFEEESQDYLGVEHCVGVSSCTSGLMLVYQALKRRARPGQAMRVAVPSFTFLASITAMRWAGLEPVFVDVDPASMNICFEDLKRVLQEEKVCAVVAVHCFGNPVPTEKVLPLCQEYDVPLIFDAAHGFGSIYEGQKLGGQGWCQVFSLTPTKMVVAGEGGVVATRDSELAQELRIAREYGNDGTYDTLFPGLNARLSELHACLARNSLKMLEDVVAHRNQVACALTGTLQSVPGLGFQAITPGSRTTYKDFTITIDPASFGAERDAVARALQSEGVPSRKYFAPPCHRHRAFQDFDQRSLPHTDTLASRCLSIPLLTRDSVEGIGRAFRKIQAHAERLGGPRP